MASEGRARSVDWGECGSQGVGWGNWRARFDLFSCVAQPWATQGPGLPHHPLGRGISPRCLRRQDSRHRRLHTYLQVSAPSSGRSSGLGEGQLCFSCGDNVQGDLGALPQDADRVGPQRLLPGPTYRTPWDQHALLSAIRQPTPTPWWQRHTPAALSCHMCPVHRCIRCSRARRRCAGCSL